MEVFLILVAVFFFVAFLSLRSQLNKVIYILSYISGYIDKSAFKDKERGQLLSNIDEETRKDPDFMESFESHLDRKYGSD